MAHLKKFWFCFEPFPKPSPINLGCGVTAYNYDDAVYLLQDRVFGEHGVPRIVECIENIEQTALDQKHVLPNIGDAAIRGIWFPQGYGVPKRTRFS